MKKKKKNNENERVRVGRERGGGSILFFDNNTVFRQTNKKQTMHHDNRNLVFINEPIAMAGYALSIQASQPASQSINGRKWLYATTLLIHQLTNPLDPMTRLGQISEEKITLVSGYLMIKNTEGIENCSFRKDYLKLTGQCGR